MDVNIKKQTVSDAFLFSQIKKTDAKYFIGYETHHKVRPLFIWVSQIIGFQSVYEKKF